MSDNQALLQKISKLLKLSTSDNPHEAATAAAMAQDLMTRHGITEMAANFDNAQPAEDIKNFAKVPEAGLDESGRLEGWRTMLAMGIARVNQCGIYLTTGTSKGARGKTIQIFGRPSNVEAVRYLYSLLTKEIERLSDLAGKGCGYTWCNNFRIGAAEIIVRRLREQQQATYAAMRSEVQSNSTALVRLDQALVKITEHEKQLEEFKKTLGLRSAGAWRPRSDAGAREQGRQAGSKISLGGGKGLTSGAKQIGQG